MESQIEETQQLSKIIEEQAVDNIKAPPEEHKAEDSGPVTPEQIL